MLRAFNHAHEALFAKDRASLYRTFYIPKSSGGLRRIDAPEPELMYALRQLKALMEENMFALYHTSAFAYVRGRCTVDAIKRHQRNESKWFIKLDFANFFGSTTLAFLMAMLSMIFPFSEIVKAPAGRDGLSKALSLCFLNGVLPQGTPISPFLTNVMMIPLDHRFSNALRNFDKNRFVYTRYADDLLISCRHDFSKDKVQAFVADTLREFHAPFSIKQEKTRYGSSAGRNWNLGVMLNKDNQITIGHKKKKHFKAMLDGYARTKKAGRGWELHDVQVLSGLISYYRMIERVYIAQPFRWVQAREDEYLRRIGRYDKTTQALFPRMFAEIVEALEQEGLVDVLGGLYMELELMSHWKGQFFTPDCVCRAIAEMQFADTAELIERQGFITVNDPTCGGGAMLIAFANVCKDKGVDFQRNVLFVGQDIDPVVARMCYVSMSLLGMPGYVIVGNTLTADFSHYDYWFTPMYFVHGFQWRRQKEVAGVGSGSKNVRLGDGSDEVVIPLETG